MSLYALVRLECDRCGATAERPPADSVDGGLDGWRWLELWADGDRSPDAARHLCPACADRFAWFLAGGPVLDEAGATSDPAQLVVAFLIGAAWPDDGGDRPDPSRCRLCEIIHRTMGGVHADGQFCRCPCHPARSYLASVGRLRDVQEHRTGTVSGAAGGDAGGDRA